MNTKAKVFSISAWLCEDDLPTNEEVLEEIKAVQWELEAAYGVPEAKGNGAAHSQRGGADGVADFG